MAGTIQDTALQIIAATASDAGVQLAVNWLNQRYAEFISRARMRQNRRYGALYAPIPVTALTVNATQGSAAIAFSTIPTDPTTGNHISLQGWHLRTSVTWYWITAHTSGQTTATLQTPFTDATGTALSSIILKRFLPITDPGARWVSSVGHPRRRKRLRFKPWEAFNSLYPARTAVGAFPWCWTEAPRFIGSLDISTVLGTTGQKFIEIYPPSNIVETYNYVYWNVPQVFAVGDSLPPEIDEWVLREGVLVDVYRYKKSQWADKGNAVMADHFSKQEMLQMAVWEKAIQQAQVTDALYHNEIPVEIDMYTDAGEFSGDITNAHDWIWSQWSQ